MLMESSVKISVIVKLSKKSKSRATVISKSTPIYICGDKLCFNVYFQSIIFKCILYIFFHHFPFFVKYYLYFVEFYGNFIVCIVDFNAFDIESYELSSDAVRCKESICGEYRSLF